MGKQTISIEIPAPPEGWVYDGVRVPSLRKDEMYLSTLSGGWRKSSEGFAACHRTPCAVRKQEPRELVRFRAWEIDGPSKNYIEAVDDIGGEWATHMNDNGVWWRNEPLSGNYKEIRPRLTVWRKDPAVEGEWLAFGADDATPFPCDQNGNPIASNGNSLDQIDAETIKTTEAYAEHMAAWRKNEGE